MSEIDIDMVARAMWAAVCTQADEIGMPVPEDTFDDLHPEDRKRHLRITRAAIEAHKAALAEAGFVIVPREPTAAMLDRGYDQSGPIDGVIVYVVVGKIWRAMIAAALVSERGTEE